MEIKLTVRAERIKILELFAGQKDLRAWLNAINFEIGPAESRMVACDGTMLGCFRIIEERQDIVKTLTNILVPIELFKQVKSKGWVEIVIDYSDAQNDTSRSHPVRVTYDGLTAVGHTITWNKYLDWRRAIPATVSGEAAQFDPALLAKLTRIATLFSLGKNSCVCLGHNGDGGALIDAGKPDFIGVIMPERAKPAKEIKAPDWVRDAGLGAHTKTVSEAPVETAGDANDESAVEETEATFA